MDSSLQLFGIKQSREIENYITSRLGISEYDLMYKAGSFVFEILKQKIKTPDQKIFILCGAGNNGGDGFIVAALAASDNLDVICIKVGDFTNQTATARKAKEFADVNNVRIISYDENIFFPADSIIIDAILGIGIKGQVRKSEAQVIDQINASGAFVIAVDIPSGLCADSGKILGTAVHADIVTTFLTYKSGLFLFEAKNCIKEIKFSNLDIDYEALTAKLQPEYYLFPAENIYHSIPQRKITAHKGDFGHVLIIGGDYGMGGAVIMAAQAAYKIGAGKVTVLTRSEHEAPLLARLPNAMTVSYNNEADFASILKDKTVIVIGPGLGKSSWSKQLFGLAMSSDLPKVIDADALNLLSKIGVNYNLQNAVLTPHPKEAARLLATTTAEIQNDRKLAINQLQKKYQSTIILKGSDSLILGDNQKLFLCPYGNPGMAVAGMGDVLSGLIAGLIAGNIEIKTAAILATTIHACAGDLIAKHRGEIGILPTDIIDHVAELIFGDELI